MQRMKQILLDDGSASGNIKRAIDFQYMKTLRFNLKPLNAWPGNRIEGNSSKYMVLINLTIMALNAFTLSSSYHYMKTNWESLTFYELGHMYIIVLMTLCCLTRLFFTLPQSTKFINVGELFLTKMHLIYFKDASEYAMETYRKVNFFCHLFTVYLTGQMLAGMALFNLITMWSNYSSGKFKQRILHNTTYEHSLYLSMPPLKIYTHFNAYVVGCIINWFLSYLCSICFCMLDLLLSLIIFNVWGHLKILLNDLASFPLPANDIAVSMDDRYATVSAEMYSEDELKFISQRLRDCIDYHRLIMDFTDKVSGAYGSMLFVYYGFHQVSGCLLLLECSQMTSEALIRYLPLSLILFQQLIQLSIIFELVGSTSEKLKDAVYDVPWQFMDTKNRKMVAMFLYNVQEPIHLKALGVVNVGVTTMATVLKTSLSYFTFLRSM